MICRECGNEKDEEYFMKHKGKPYDLCRECFTTKLREATKATEERKCKYCGKMFIPTKRDKRLVFCGIECQLNYRKESGYMKRYYHANRTAWINRQKDPEIRERKNKARREMYAIDEERRLKIVENTKRYYQEHPEVKARQRLAKYGLTTDEYKELYNNQNGKCAICGSDGSNGKWRKLYIDHNHESGKVRGLLCSNCNFAIGHFQDKPELLEKAAKYLRESDGE